MAIDRDHDDYIPVCDVCGESLFSCESFNVARQTMKEQGWKTELKNGHFENYCPECQ